MEKKIYLNIFGTSETRWEGNGKMLSDAATILYSGGRTHEKGVEIMLHNITAKTLLS